MGFSDSLKGMYFKLEDKYYDFLDWIEDKGLPVYKIVDAIEAKNIPSFPVALISIFIIALLLYSIVLGFAPANSALSVQVFDSENTPVLGAVVSLNFEEKSLSQATNAEGIATFVIPLGAQVTGTAKKTGYKDQSLSFVVEKTVFTQTVNLIPEINTVSKTIQLMDKSSGSLLKKEVSLMFSCTDAVYNKEKTSSTGTVLLDDIPKDCGKLVAVPTNGFTIEQGNIDLSQGAPQLKLSEVIIEKGTVKVFLKDKQSNPVAGVTIKLVRSDGVQQSSKPSSTAGSVQFDAVPVGNYYIRTYDGYNAKFADFDTSIEPSGIKQLAKEETVEFSISLVEKIVGKVKILVKDKANGAAVQNATVSLMRDNIILNSQSSGLDGKVEFAASESTGYSVKIDHQNYLIGFLQGISPSENFTEIELVPANSTNILALQVSVLDQRKQPVENARLTLKKLDGTVVSDTISTGTDGNAMFERIPADTYYVYAIKDNFEGINSSTITIAERQLNNISITMNIGSGNIEITVLDEELKPIQGASVKMMNSFNMKEIERGNTNAEGKKSFSARADRKVYFIAQYEGNLDYETVPMAPQAGNTIEKEISMAKNSAKFGVKLLGLFVEKELASDSLTAGQKYIAKLRLTVPASSSYGEAGIHLRAGKTIETKTNTMEADELYISKVNAATNTIIKSTTFTPPAGYSTDAKNVTTGNAKWANIVFSKPTPGTYDIEAEITVKENAQLGSILEIQYRGWAKATTYLREPKDQSLGESETANGRQALYANSLKQVYTVGPSSLCDESFCHIFSIEDIGQELVTSIIDSYDAKISGNYKLLFTIISKEDTEKTASELELLNESTGLKLGDYSITSADGRKLSGSASGSVSVAVGDLKQNSSIQGELNFKATKEGLNNLLVSIKSQKENIFLREIGITVNSASEMKAVILPKIIVPFINNDILLHVTDNNSDNGIANASVNITINNNAVFSGQTDGSGTVHFTLESPNANDLLKIEVSKNGYRQIEMEVKVTENILSIMPEEVSELLSVSGIFSKERDIHLQNDTTMTLKIEDFEISKDFKGLAKVSLKENIVGTTIKNGIDNNIFLKMELTEEGKRVREITSLEGMFTIYVSSSEMQKTWAVNIPVKIRIGFGAEVSDATCIVLEPVEWKAFTGRNQAEQRFSLKNNCRVDKTAIALRNIQAKIEYSTGQSLGTFVATSSLSGSQTATLSNTFSKIGEIIGAGEEASITVTFTPDSNVVGGESSAKIIIKAINPTENGEETILANTAVSLKINDLAQCIEIKRAKNLRINSCPYSTGYGNYQNYGYGGYGYTGVSGTTGTSAYGLQSSRFASPYQYGDTAFAGYPEQLTATNYPYSSFSEPYYSNSNYGSGMNNSMWQCGTTSFAVANNCASNVQIDLESASELMIGTRSFDLGPNEQKDVPVEASYFIGTYPVDVKAKIKENKEKSTSISTIYIAVEMVDDPSQYNDCIKISSTKFQFNDFIQKPVTGKVFNTCYAQGVRLDFDSVKFSQSAYGETSTSGTGMGLIENLEVIDLTNKTMERNRITQVLEFEITKNINYRRQEGFPRSGTPFSQLGGLRVFGTQGYFRVEAPAIIIVNYNSNFTGASAKKFKVTIEDLWNLLGTAEGLNVYGCPNIPAQKCIMETALEFSPGKDECLDVDQFDASGVYQSTPRDIMRVGECSPDTAYNQTLDQKARELMAKTPGMTYDQAQSLAKGSAGTVASVGNVCGTADTITLKEGSNSFEVDGVKVEFILSDSTAMSVLGQMGGKHAIVVKIDRSKSTKAGPIQLNKRLQALVYRQTPMGEQEVVIPFHACVIGTGTDTISQRAKDCAEKLKIRITDPTKVNDAFIEELLKSAVNDYPAECKNLKQEEKEEIKKYLLEIYKPVAAICDTGKSGQTEFTDLGFDRLPFTWQFAKIEANTCDSDAGKNYCDTVQSLIAVTKKTKDIIEKIDNWETAMANKSSYVKSAMKTDDSKIAEFTNTKNLYRWALKQLSINDEKNEYNGDIVYFLDSDGRIVTGKVKTTDARLQQKIKDATETLKNNNLAQMDSLLDEIKKDKKLSREIVVELELEKDKGITANDKQNFLTSFLAKFKTYVNGKFLIIPFIDYYTFNSEIKKQCGSNWDDCKNATKTVTINGVVLDKDFFSRFLNSVSFKRAILDDSELTIGSEDLAIVLDKAATIDTISKSDFITVWKEINSTMFLAKDDYDQAVKTDFGNYFDLAKNNISSEDLKSKEFISSGNMQFDFSTGQTMAEAGEYSVLLNYNYSDPDKPTMLAEMKKLAEPQGKIIDNWFLYNPIDGAVGLENRNGYGISLKDKVIAGRINIVKDGTRDADMITASASATSGKQYIASIGQDYSDVSNGTILNVTSSSFTYTPSSAFKLEMTLTGVGNRTALYNLAENGKNLSDKKLISWNSAIEKTGLTCKTGQDLKYYGIETSADVAKAALFVPASTSYSLNLGCAKKGATLGADEIDIKQGKSIIPSIEASETLNQTMKLPATRTNTVYELKQYINAIKEGKVCVDSKKDSLFLGWHLPTILK